VTDPISSGSGTEGDPWRLKTPPLSSEYTMNRDNRDGVEVIVCTVGKSVLVYDARCVEDLHAMLQQHGDWVELGSADEQKPAKDGTVEAWAARPTTRPGAGTGARRACGADSACTCRRCSSISVSLRSSTTRVGTGCA
jgi:hypothetical protein